MPFSPAAATAANNGGTYILSANSTSANISVPIGQQKVRVYNEGPDTAFVEIGVTAYVPTGSTPGTDTGSMPIAAGAGSIPLFLDKGAAVKIAAVCRAAKTAVLHLTFGDGDALG